MRYRWDPAYPMGRRDATPYDAGLRASDDERNAVADRLSRHYAEGRLDEAEFKTRLDTAMSATTRGDLNGLFHDLPKLPEPAPPPPTRRQRAGTLALPARLRGRRRRGHAALLSPVPRAVVPVRDRRLHPLAPRRGRTLAPPRRWGDPAQFRHGQLSTQRKDPMRTHLPHPGRTPDDPIVDDDLTDALRAMPLFAGLPGEELEELAAECELCTAHPGQVVQAQDVPVRYWHVITGGHAVVQRDGTPIGLLGQGDSWSEHSLLNQQRSSIAVVALSPLTLLTLSQRRFFAVPERHPVLAGRLVARSATSADRLALPVFNALVHLDLARIERTEGHLGGQYD